MATDTYIEMSERERIALLVLAAQCVDCEQVQWLLWSDDDHALTQIVWC